MARKLDNWIKGYLELNKNNEAPESYLTWTALSTVAAAVRRKVVLKMGQQKVYPNMYVLLVGPPGKTRKGSAMEPARDLLVDLGISLAADATTRAQLIRRLKQSTESVTEAKTGNVLSHSSLSIFALEFTVFLRREATQLMSDLTDLYDNRNTWVDETKKDDDAGKVNNITAPFINLLGATTPELIRINMPIEAIGGGLTSRMIFVCETYMRFRTPFDVYAMSEEYSDQRKNLMHDLEVISMLQGKFTMSEKFLEKYITWYENLSRDCPFDNMRFEGYWSRRQNHLRKMSMLSSIAKSDDLRLTEEDFDWALNLLENTEQKMPLAFGSMGRSQHAELLQPIMHVIAQKGVVTRSELLSIFMMETTSFELAKILETLEQVNFIESTQNSNGEILIKYIK